MFLLKEKNEIEGETQLDVELQRVKDDLVNVWLSGSFVHALGVKSVCTLKGKKFISDLLRA